MSLPIVAVFASEVRMTEDDLFAKLQAVQDGPTFLAFVDALARERTESVRLEALSPSSPWGPDHLGWENIRIETFLDAAARCAEAHARSDGWVMDNPWRWFARFLYGGKIYE